MRDGESKILLSPDEEMSTMQNMALGTLIELRPRKEGRLDVVAEFDKEVMSEMRMRDLMRVYGGMLQDVAAASQNQHSTMTVEMALS